MIGSRCFSVVIAFMALHLDLSSVWAEACPPKPVVEEGGTHRCYADGRRGHVHLWTPKEFEPKSAVTVIYVHGHNLHDDGCANAHYLDCAWDAHGLASQFAKSGLNALFVAVEGPVRAGRDVKWTSLGVLLRSVRRRGGIVPPTPVVAVAHSAGIYTVMRFLGDSRLRHVVSLDALYLRSPKVLAKWYRGSKRRRLTLVGAESRYARTSALGRKLSCASKTDVFGPYSNARCVVAVDPDIGHMDLIRDGRVLPGVLARINTASR
ncbi:MAG: hypothetical protein WC866_00080 [Patescibacteria group bacterium]|jgi:hypothetical protein